MNFKRPILVEFLQYLDLDDVDGVTRKVLSNLILKAYKNQIVDKKRIKKILNNIRKKSISNNIDPKITNRIWKNMVWAYIDFEKRNFKKK